ncbi:ion transporter [Chloroflexota bacterium]
MTENENSYETVGRTRPGDRVIHVTQRRRRHRLRIVPSIPGILRFLVDIVRETPLVPLLIVLVVLWLGFSLGVYLVERLVNEQFHSYGYTLWWTFTAMQTQGDNRPGPITPLGMLIGGIWSVIGTVIFFGVIIATIYSYYMIPKRRRSKVIIDALQYNLNEIEYLSIDELTALRDTVTNIVNARISDIEKRIQNQS